MARQHNTTEALAPSYFPINTVALLQALSPLVPLSQTERARRGGGVAFIAITSFSGSHPASAKPVIFAIAYSCSK
ncbi:Uncharacterised protein [[Actinobacillus] rossii]|uniref:Uncharacterized protein n=1 Tax=[Actinobacillus] rossii TaxID=123820 RepID=A0A380U0U1_9PAST|nr:Uncharacterised protein [[Actinobacillus] rossii]